jgi:hypothetical protein
LITLIFQDETPRQLTRSQKHGNLRAVVGGNDVAVSRAESAIWLTPGGIRVGGRMLYPKTDSE